MILECDNLSDHERMSLLVYFEEQVYPRWQRTDVAVPVRCI